MPAFDPIWSTGCMSGTSMDGVDAASVFTDGEAVLARGPGSYREYSSTERSAISAAQGCWPEDAKVHGAKAAVEAAHLDLLGDFDLGEAIGFHGQTLAHDAVRGRTHQTGDGQVIANATGCTVVWDFRTEDMVQGGQGAPLAPFYHFALARTLGLREPGVLLNIGGVANLTWVDPGRDAPEAEGAILAFDTGPGNAPMDDIMLQRTGSKYDKQGMLASEGTVSQAIVGRVLTSDYFARTPPKSLDRADFNSATAEASELDTEDALATLAAITASSIAIGMSHLPAEAEWVAVCGGGRKNEHLMGLLVDLLRAEVFPVERLGLDGDMIEAEAFAFLAVRAMRGLPISCPATTGCARPTTGGRISVPQSSGR